MEKYGRQFCGIGGDRLPLEIIGINQKQSELIGVNRINSDKLRCVPINLSYDTFRYSLIHFDTL